jgi:adenine-specific DNA glycosylase
MTWDWILQALELLFGPGFVAVFWVWIKNRDTRKAASAKEREDVYKTMYDNLSDTLIDLQNENIKLYKAVRELNRTIQKATACPHFAVCPLRSELQNGAGVVDIDSPAADRPKRQSKRKTAVAMVRGDPGEQGDADHTER